MSASARPNPYAPPQSEVESPAAPEDGAGERVGGWWRVLAVTIDAAAFLGIMRLISPYWRMSTGTVDVRGAAAYLVMTGLWVALEIAIGASPAMWAFGFRVRRADGSRPTHASLAAKAFAVRIPNVSSLYDNVGVLFGLHVVRATSIVPRSPLRFFEFLVGLVWMIGYLLAFSPRRQTHIDRVLDLAVYRGRGW